MTEVFLCSIIALLICGAATAFVCCKENEYRKELEELKRKLKEK
jgi:hypothetical protein